MRELAEEEYVKWSKLYEEASGAQTERESKLAETEELIETELLIL